MHKSLICLSVPLLLLAGCATQRPQIALCPPPPQLPALQKLPQSVTAGSFLTELESILLPSQPVEIKSDYSLRPANGNTKLPAKP